MSARRHATISWQTIVRWKWHTRPATIIWLVDGKRATRTDSLYLNIPWAHKHLDPIWLRGRYAYFSVGNVDYQVALDDPCIHQGDSADA